MERGIMNELTLLLIEDNPGDARLLYEMLRDLGKGYHIVWVQTLAEALKEIASKRFHLILCDLDLKDAQGFETASAVIAVALDTPIIIITGQDDDQTALEVIKHGVQDYLVKNTVTPELIGRSIRYAIERKQAEMALWESEERFRRLLQNIPSVAVQGYGLDGTTQYWNQASERLYGYSAQEAIGRNLLDLIIPPEMRAVVTQAVQQMAETGQPTPASELSLMRRDGSRVAVFSSHVIVRIPGRVPEFFCVDIDLTERKQAEEKIKASLDEKEVLLKEVHHRVKNNLQVISSLISLQADILADTQLQGVLGDVRDRVRSMALVHEKLYQTEDLAQLDFAEYALSLLNYLRSAHGAATGNVRLNTSLAPLILPVETAVSCGLILNELISNVFKHAFPNGGGEVTVTLEHDPATGAVCLRVRDNGVGLPADLDWRKSSTLGLRLVHMLAGQIGGMVQTGSGPDPGPGTDFQVNFKV
jgi:PAS domain S-box-containing protein